MKSVTLEIQFKRIRQTDKPKFIYGKFWCCDDPDHYIIRIDTRASLLDQACSLIHEFIHVVFDVFFKRIDEEKEHTVCNGTESTFKKLITKYWRAE